MSEIFGAVGTVHQALNYHLKRHNVLSSNVANVDTPGFRPQDVVRAPEEGAQGSLRVHKTDNGHLSTALLAADDELEVVTDETVRPGQDGNSVTLEREMSKLAANDIRYETASRIVSKQIGMLRYAAADGMGG